MKKVFFSPPDKSGPKDQHGHLSSSSCSKAAVLIKLCGRTLNPSLTPWSLISTGTNSVH